MCKLCCLFINPVLIFIIIHIALGKIFSAIFEGDTYENPQPMPSLIGYSFCMREPSVDHVQVSSQLFVVHSVPNPLKSLPFKYTACLYTVSYIPTSCTYSSCKICSMEASTFINIFSKFACKIVPQYVHWLYIHVLRLCISCKAMTVSSFIPSKHYILCGPQFHENSHFLLLFFFLLLLS